MSICQMNICAPSTLDPYVQILIPKVMILEGGGGLWVIIILGGCMALVL